MNAARVLVLGSPGAGKTALARTLAAVTGLPLHHLDDEYWGAGWARPAEQDWRRRQTELISRPEWIIEGNYLPTIALRATRAELAVIVDAPTALCLVRAVRRAWRIHRGDFGALPERVRADTVTGTPVRATRDFPALLAKIARFRRRDLPVVVAEAGRHGATVVLAATRTRATRTWCARHQLSPRVVPLPEAGSASADLCRLVHHRSTRGGAA
ncbi:hypothetical protein [Amycolatopsis sp. cmx-4-61]|uniref:hypothetical protein n=1 Tax=Amycolatopsis sp. cmx-4-61 TaxID=2790937 RepID=UPI00397C7F64